MRIALLAVDSDYPNLALMKISSWHKAQGDKVEWYSPFEQYDVLYMARWAMRRELYAVTEFKDFEPRKGFRCAEYF